MTGARTIANCRIDPGLANHRRLFEVLNAEICRSQRTERQFSILLLEPDPSFAKIGNETQLLALR